jgi:hypothetical protein
MRTSRQWTLLLGHILLPLDLYRFSATILFFLPLELALLNSCSLLLRLADFLHLRHESHAAIACGAAVLGLLEQGLNALDECVKVLQVGHGDSALLLEDLFVGGIRKWLHVDLEEGSLDLGAGCHAGRGVAAARAAGAVPAALLRAAALLREGRHVDRGQGWLSLRKYSSASR